MKLRALLIALLLASPALSAQRDAEASGGVVTERTDFEQHALPFAGEEPEPEAPPEEGAAEESFDGIESIDDSWLDEDDLGPDPAERDHTPRWNRRVFNFNESFMKYVMKPISRGYQAITPKFVREMIHNGFDNLESPVILANDLMQLDLCRAGRTLGRFALNTTAGIAGTFDVA